MSGFRTSTLEEIDKFLRECVIPELTQLRLEIMALRKAVWPYVQAQKEINQLDDIEGKAAVMRDLDDEDIRELLVLKAKHAKSFNLQKREYELIKKSLS